MKQMKDKDIIRFLKNEVEPIENTAYGSGYRASVHLVDGVFLPCVIFRNPKTTVELAIKRFNEEQSGHSIFKNNANGYKDIVKTFVTKGNCVNSCDIASVGTSEFAFPLSALKQIRGETTMGWTGFVAKMKDGKCFGFGTTFLIEFFQMPEGYAVKDIDEIINHSYISKAGELCSHKVPFTQNPDDYNNAVIYRERPFFECYIEDL